MTALRVLLARCHGWLVRRRRVDELTEEIRHHLELLEADARNRGCSAPAAAAEARKQFGGLEQIKESVRDQVGLPWFDGVFRELRLSWRSLWRSPGFFIASVAAIGLGIAATTLTLSWTWAVLTAAAPIGDMSPLVGLWLHNRSSGETKTVVASADVEQWREGQEWFDLLVAQRNGSVNLGGAGEPIRARASSVTADYFALYNATPVLGRGFTSDDTSPGAARVAVLGYRLWQERFEAAPEVLGRVIRLDDEPTTIVGVLPRNDYSPEVMVPLPIDPSSRDFRERSLFVSARLAPGVSFAAAAEGMRLVGERLEREQPERYGGWGVNVRPLQEEFVGPQARFIFRLLVAAALTVLLVGCANVGNLMLVRGIGRAREMAVRTAIGASRWQLVRQSLLEGFVVSVTGALLGLLMTHWGLSVLRAFTEAGTTYMERAVVDGRLVAVAALSAAVSTLGCALLPALRTTRDLRPLPVRDAGSTSGVRAGQLRGTLVGIEVTTAVLLVSMAVLFLRTLAALQSLATGFDASNVLTARVALPRAGYSSERVVDFVAEALSRLESQGWVIDAGVTTRLPAEGSRFNPNRSLAIEGREPARDEVWFAEDLTVSPGYFDAMRVPFATGRDFNAGDAAGAPLSVLVNETMARRYWPNGSAVGARLRLGDEPTSDGWRTVVGVVRDIRNDDIDAPPLPHVFVPLTQRPANDMTLVVRTRGVPEDQVRDLRAVLATIDPNLPLFDIKTMKRVLAEDLQGTVVIVGLVTTFSSVALVLAALGIYGVVAYGVGQSTREMCIRVALGATRPGVAALVVGRNLVPPAIGLTLGLVMAAGASRLVAGLLFGVRPSDPLTYGAAALLMAVAALLASIVPAIRAMQADPAGALRGD